ncbi:MAG: leucine-rich repeat protein, partial [Clostridia bacterium]|nr:leucine-rich repeat protein [Clostridia bacterium]
MVNNRLDVSLDNFKYYDQSGNEIKKPEAMFALNTNKSFKDVYEYETDASKESTGRFGLTYRAKSTSFALNVGQSKELCYGIALPNEAGTEYPQVYRVTFDIIIVSEEQPVERSPFDYRIETDASGNVGILAAPEKNDFSLEDNTFDLVEMESKVVNITVPLTQEFTQSYMYSCLTLIPGDNVPAEAQGNALVWFQLVYLMMMSDSGYLPIVKSPVTYNVPGYGMHTFTPENWASDIQLLAALDTASQESFAANYFRAAPSEGGTITIPVELYKLDSFPIYQVVQSFSLGIFFLVNFLTVNQSALIEYTTYQAAVKEGKIEPEQFGLTISSSYYDFLVKLLEGKINKSSFEGLELNDESRAFTNNVQYVPCIPGTRFTYTPAVQWLAPSEFEKVYINTTATQIFYGINAKSYDSDLRMYTAKDGLLYTADEKTLVGYPIAKPGAEFTIPEGATGLYNMSFAGTKNLATLNFAKSIINYGTDIFIDSSIGVLNIYSENLDASKTALIDSINNSNIETVNILASRYMSETEISQLQASCSATINITFINNLSKLIYDIREDGAHVVGMEDKTLENIIVSDTVEIGGEIYTIVGIDASVFVGCSNLVGLKLPHTLKYIGANNFGTLTTLTKLELGVAELETFGTGNTHANLQIWAKKETTYSKIIASDSKAIGVDWQLLVDGGNGSFDYQLTIGTTMYRVSGSSLKGEGSQYNTYLAVFPQTADSVVVSLVTNFTGYADDNYYFDGINEQVSLVLMGANGEETKILGSETGAAGYVQFSQSTVSSSFPVLGADPVMINPGSQLRLRIYYTVLQHVKCFTKDTEVTLADGTIKMIQDIGFDDLLMTYDFDRGEFSASYPVWIATPDKYDHYYRLSFDDGSTLEVVLAHRLFVFGSAGWEYVKSIDADYSCIGKKFLRQIMVDGVPTLTETTCTNIERINEECIYYNIVTSQALNFMSNGYIGATGIANMYTFEKIDDQTYVHNQEQLEFTKSGTT